MDTAPARAIKLDGISDREKFKVLGWGLRWESDTLKWPCARKPDLIFFDPPYFTKKRKAYRKGQFPDPKAACEMDLFYWESRGTAEVDFLCENFDSIFPLGAKAGINPHSKSLKSFDQKFHPPYLGRTSQLNFKQDGRILNIPLYAVSLFPLHSGNRE